MTTVDRRRPVRHPLRSRNDTGASDSVATPSSRRSTPSATAVPCRPGGSADHSALADDTQVLEGTLDPAISSGFSTLAPDFVDFTGSTWSDSWDFDLLPTSALIHAGTSALSNPDGSTSDIGAYGGPDADWSFYCADPTAYGAVYDLSVCP